MISIHLKGGGHQQAHAQALATGLRRFGIPVRDGNARTGDTVACWGWRVGQRYRALGFNVLVLERGYLGDRFRYSSLALNGLNGRGWFPEYPEAGARFDQHFGHLLRPWSPDGDYVLICGQVPGDASLQGRDLSPWYAQQARHFSEQGHRVLFRPHPLASRRGGTQKIPKAETNTGDLQQALSGAKLIVTWNSNSGVDALMAGKRAVCFDEGSMIHGWDGTDAGRIALLKSIAGKQWLMEEISSGEALEGFAHALKQREPA